MITRRHIRIKVLHHLYAHALDNEIGAATLLKNLQKSIEEVHVLFAWDINAFLRLHKIALEKLEFMKKRKVVEQDQVERLEKFVSIPFFEMCALNGALSTLMEASNVDWSEYSQHFNKLWEQLYTSERFDQFIQDGNSQPSQKRFLKEVYQEYIAENEFLHDIYEDIHAQWSDDLDAAQMMSAKVISSWSEERSELIIPQLFKDEEDAAFGPFLMRKYFEFSEDSVERIKEKSKNWESDRIARTDVLLMKLCIAEWRGMDEIPVKVSLNEYLDLAKQYSTPKSSSFINGILDKIVTNLREEGVLQKVGRGMID